MLTRNINLKGMIIKRSGNQGRVNIIEANIFDEKKIKELCKDTDICINLIGILYEKKRGNTFKNIHSLFPSLLAKLCKENNIIVCSDEIHADLVLEEGATHIPFASFDEYKLENSITITGPCKTYNRAGFPIAAAVIPNNELRSEFQRNTKRIRLI